VSGKICRSINTGLYRGLGTGRDVARGMAVGMDAMQLSTGIVDRMCKGIGITIDRGSDIRTDMSML
jgi:hypothetical protein